MSRWIKPEALKGVLDDLDKQDRFVLQGFYGLDGKKPRTLEDIGDEIGVSRQRVHHIKKMALKKALQKLKEKGGAE